MAYQAGGAKADSMTETLVTNPAEEKKPERASGPKGVLQWFMEDPWGRKPFALFVLAAFASIVWLIWYLAAATTGYIVAGIAAIVMSAYGAWHFKLLLALKEEVEQFARSNAQFKKENAALQKEVDKMKRAKDKLQQTEDELRASNDKMRENLDKFKQLDANLAKMAGDNVEGLGEVLKKSKAALDQWKEEIASKEKGILMKVFDEFEFKDRDEGLTEDEFGKLLDALPADYREAFDSLGKSFAEVAGDDSMISIEEFSSLTEIWKEVVVERGGSHL